MYCLITGASRGLGLELAKRFWKAGYSLVLTARNETSFTDAFESRTNQSIIRLGCDLSHPSAVKSLSTHIQQSIPKLDVIINNAAVQGPIGPAWENDPQAYQETLQVNLLAPIALCQTFVPWMAKTGGGSIINVSGGGATSPRENFSAYAIAKTALVRFSEILAQEAMPLGIRVNCIAPGAMKTDMLVEVARNAMAAGEKEYNLARKVLEQGGAPMERVADLCHFLTKPESQGITGKLISAVWDNWESWPAHLDELNKTDAYTLRRITGRDRGFDWGDK